MAGAVPVANDKSIGAGATLGDEDRMSGAGQTVSEGAGGAMSGGGGRVIVVEISDCGIANSNDQSTDECLEELLEDWESSRTNAEAVRLRRGLKAGGCDVVAVLAVGVEIVVTLTLAFGDAG